MRTRIGPCATIRESAPVSSLRPGCANSLPRFGISSREAKKVSATYDRCIQQIKGDACPVLFPTDPQTGDTSVSLPADCNSVIQMFEPGAPTPAIASSAFRAASTAPSKHRA